MKCFGVLENDDVSYHYHQKRLLSDRLGVGQVAMPPQGLEPWTQGLRVPCSTN